MTLSPVRFAELNKRISVRGSRSTGRVFPLFVSKGQVRFGVQTGASESGRYLSVGSASCGLLEAIKTCRLELIDKRIWVSCLCIP